MVQVMERRDFFVSILLKGEQIDFESGVDNGADYVFSLLQCVKVDSGERDDGGVAR